MRIGQIYLAPGSKAKAHITSINEGAKLVSLCWTERGGKECSPTTNTYGFWEINRYIADGILKICDELPSEDPNRLFRERK